MPRYQHAARQLKRPIEQGELAPGTRLPLQSDVGAGTGRFSRHGGKCYGELVAQGWLGRRGGQARFVSNALRFENAAPPIPAVFAGESPGRKPFQMGLPALDLFHARSGRSNGASVAHADTLRSGVGDVCGEAILRRAMIVTCGFRVALNVCRNGYLLPRLCGFY